MNEIMVGTLATIALIPSIAFGWISMVGGRDVNFLGIRARIWKRFIAPVVFVSLVIAMSLINGKYNHWFLLCYATYILNIIGYGSKGLGDWFKILRRIIWSIIRTASCLPIVLILATSQVSTLFILQAIIGMVATVILGVYNPLKAAAEEFLINFISVVFVTYMVI